MRAPVKTSEYLLLPINLNFKFSGKVKRIELYGSFGELVTNKAHLIEEIEKGWFLTEIPRRELVNLTTLSTDKFLASPFNPGTKNRENF
jgi:hypothetical protein